MSALENLMMMLNREEPIKIPVLAYDFLRVGSQGGIYRRLKKRGLCIVRFIPTYKPTFRGMNFMLEDVKHTRVRYLENGINKYREIFDTPIGSITCLMRLNPVSDEDPPLSWGAYEEHFVKNRSDWRVLSYIFKGMADQLVPNYKAFEREQDELGDEGICFGFVGKTPFQRAWVEMADLETAVVDFEEKPEELLEFIEVQRFLHERQAEITGNSPAKFILVVDHITTTISPKYYKEYCIPYWQMYANAIKGSGKVLGAHHDGQFGHLKKEIADSPLDVIESFTVPPGGDVSLTEAKKLWPDKMLFVNTPPHIAQSPIEEVREAYEQILTEWGQKRGLLIEHSEDIPMDKLEMNLSTALDVCGY